jgi:hypothetical protein
MTRGPRELYTAVPRLSSLARHSAWGTHHPDQSLHEFSQFQYQGAPADNFLFLVWVSSIMILQQQESWVRITLQMTASQAVVLGVDFRLVLLITYWRSCEAGVVTCLRALSNDGMGLSIVRSLILVRGRTYRFTDTTIIFKSFENIHYTAWFKNMDSVSYVYISWTIHGTCMWMIYITFERGSPKFSNTAARNEEETHAAQQSLPHFE